MNTARRSFLRSGALFTTAALCGTMAFEDYCFETAIHDLSPGQPGIPCFTVVHLSDLHFPAPLLPAGRLVSVISALSPDLVVLTGDMVEKPEGLNDLDTFIGLLPRTVRKYAVPGNWDYWSNAGMNNLRRLLERHNGRLLVNETDYSTVGGRIIAVTGIDDFVAGMPDYSSAFTMRRKTDFHIALAHCPQSRDDLIATHGIPMPDILLAGHTHGGQFSLLGFRPFLPEGSGRYVHGWYRDRTPCLYVSRGLGTSVLPLRFGARAECTIFRIPFQEGRIIS